jgi:hypothetical protein
VLEFAGRIRVGVSPHGDLAAREFVFKLPSGLGLPNLAFFVLLPEGLGLQPLHVTPCFILQAAIIAYLHEMSVEATLLPASSSSTWGRMITSLTKVVCGLSHGSIPHAPQLFGGGKRAVLWLHLFGFDGLSAASNAAKRSVAARPPHGRRSRRAQVHYTRSGIAPPAIAGHAAPTSPRGSYKTSYAVEVAAACLDGLVLTPVGGWGARTSSPWRTR